MPEFFKGREAARDELRRQTEVNFTKGVTTPDGRDGPIPLKTAWSPEWRNFKTGILTGSVEAAAKPKEEELYKTVMCKFWQEWRCQRGSKCTFAHGEHELARNRPAAMS
jgi:hypothetical protein